MNSFTSANVTNVSMVWGFVSCLVSATGFAVNYLPVKRYDTGDGIFFQWILTNAIFLGSFFVAGYKNFPTFHPLVMLGGFMWSTGNICVVPIVKMLGLGMGFLLWSSTSMVFAWASGRFGWFGIDPQLPKSYIMNYIGFILSAISPIMYTFVKVEVPPIEIKDNILFENTILENIQETHFMNRKMTLLELLKRTFKTRQKFIGVSLSIFSGALFGFNFIPVTYVKNRYPYASQSDLDHLFAQCAGIYLGGSLYFVIYCMIKRSKPIIYSNVVLPAFMSGLLWFIAYLAMFFANESLDPAITAPIVTPLCGVISTLIAVIVYREVKGIRNLIVLIVAMIISSTAAVVIGLSKIL